MVNNVINLISRVLLSLIFIVSGFNKIMNYDETVLWMEKYNISGTFLTPAIFFEILAPLFIIFGYQLRITSLLLAVFCLMTASLFHYDFSDQMQLVAFLKNIAIAGGFLLLFIYGPGDFSIDKKIK